MGRLGWTPGAVGDLTFADVAAADEAARFDVWDRAALIATFSINANPFLKKWAAVSNPLRPNYRRVKLEDVPGLD